jgi:hypothetical protein
MRQDRLFGRIIGKTQNFGRKTVGKRNLGRLGPRKEGNNKMDQK